MLLVDSFNDIDRYTPEILAAGYGYSVLGPQVEIRVELESVLDCLKDWEWTSWEPRPSWLG